MPTEDGQDQAPVEGAVAGNLGQSFLPNVSPPPPLDMDSAKCLEGWKMWKQTFQKYLIVSGLDKKDSKYQAALLLHCVGKDALRIYTACSLPTLLTWINLKPSYINMMITSSEKLKSFSNASSLINATRNLVRQLNNMSLLSGT